MQTAFLLRTFFLLHVFVDVFFLPVFFSLCCMIHTIQSEKKVFVPVEIQDKNKEEHVHRVEECQKLSFLVFLPKDTNAHARDNFFFHI